MRGVSLAMAVALVAIPGLGRTETLSAQVSTYLRRGLNATGPIPDIAPFQLERLATRAADFPVASTSPGLAFRFDPELGTYVPVESIGPALLERVETVGRHAFAIGASYLHANIDELDGEPLADLLSDVLAVGTIDGIPAGAVVDSDEASIEQSIVDFYGTYGVTDRWDVNVLIPLVVTSLDLAGSGTDFDPLTGVVTGGRRVHMSDEKVGVGDVLFRTKYRLTDEAPVNTAVGFGVRVPTGSAEDFQGLGDPTFTPALVFSRIVARQDLHLNLGIEVNGTDLERTRGRYGIGATLQAVNWAALLIDFVGSSSFVDDEFTFESPFFLMGGGVTATRKPGGGYEVASAVPRTDVLDLAVGVKLVGPWGTSGFATAIVPVTDDALRSDVTVVVGGEWALP
jgi:hypothetical protein